MPVHDEGYICRDPNCRCHQLRDQDGFFNAYVFSMKNEVTLPCPVSVRHITEGLKAPLTALGESCSIGGIVPGHIKGTVAAGETVLFCFSVTRCDTVDLTWNEAVSKDERFDRYTVTLNILSTQHTTGTAEAAQSVLSLKFISEQ